MLDWNRLKIADGFRIGLEVNKHNLMASEVLVTKVKPINSNDELAHNCL